MAEITQKENPPNFRDEASVYAACANGMADAALSPAVRSLIQLTVALTVPSVKASREALRLARTVATDDQINSAVAVASTMRAGAATAYGRLVFKYIDALSTDHLQCDREYMKHFRGAAPDLFTDWRRFMTAAHGSSCLSERDEELIAIACAAVSRCVYCLETHGQKAIKAGATAGEIAVAIHLAIAGSAEATLVDFSDISTPADA